MVVIKSLMIKVFVWAVFNIIAGTLFGTYKNYEGLWWQTVLTYAKSGLLPMLLFTLGVITSVMLVLAIWKTSVAVINVKGHRFVTVSVQGLATLFLFYHVISLNSTIALFIVRTIFGFDPYSESG